MTGRQTWTGWPNDGYPWQNGEGYFEQTQPVYGQSYEQGALFNHSSIQESRDEMLNQPWGFQPQMNHQNPYTPVLPTEFPKPYSYPNDHNPPNHGYQQPQTSSYDQLFQMMNAMQEDLNKMSNTFGGFVDDIRQACTTSQVQTEDSITQEPSLQPCYNEASHYDECYWVQHENRELGVEESSNIAEMSEGEEIVKVENPSFEFEECGGDGESELDKEEGIESCEESSTTKAIFKFEEPRFEKSQRNEEIDEEILIEVVKEENPNFEFEEKLFDGECGSNGESGSECCENSSDVECERCDDSLIEPFDESSATKTQDLVKEIINIFEKLWVEDEDESNHDSKIENLDEPTIPKLEKIPQTSTKPVSCQTIHYTKLEISGVMYIDLPTSQEGVNLGIELPLSMKNDLKLLSKPGRPVISLCKTKDRQHGPNLLLPSELLQGFAHVYDPFERG